jgi:transcriptional regulator with XRE-family HTH domain
MDRFEFGMLVSSLREDLRWTQSELAEKSEVDIAVISNIERGARKFLLKDNILLKLADGLRLTTLERQEFLFAASGVSELDAVRTEGDAARAAFDAETFIHKTGRDIGRILLPAFVTDSFCDILLANHCVLEFYNASPSLFVNADHVVGGYNQMRYVFHNESNFRDLIGEDRWEQFALMNARYFRRQTLRVRPKPYFSLLLKEFFDNKKYPDFERCWRKMGFEGGDDFFIPFEEQNPDGDSVIVAVESLLALTPFGELRLHQLLPLNQKTAKRIEIILDKVGQGYRTLAPFPDVRKW